MPFDLRYNLYSLTGDGAGLRGAVIMRPGQLREETPDVSSGGTTGTAVLPPRRRRPRPGTLRYPVSFHSRPPHTLQLPTLDAIIIAH